MAEVEYDPVTYEIRPVHITAVQEIGKALNPMLAAGQIEGGTAQGVGYALLEEVVMRDGRMANAQLTNYIVADDDGHAADRRRDPGDAPTGTARSAPRAWASCRSTASAPAIANAVRHLGLDVRALPLTPERVMAASQTGTPSVGGKR